MSSSRNYQAASKIERPPVEAPVKQVTPVSIRGNLEREPGHERPCLIMGLHEWTARIVEESPIEVVAVAVVADVGLVAYLRGTS